jgi:hypothetical protein
MTADDVREPEAEWLTPGVKGIGTASLLADAGHEVPTALLPSLSTSSLSASPAALGVIKGVSDALAGFARFGGGALADDPDRRRTVAVGGYSATAVPSAATAEATSVWQVAILRAGDGSRASGPGPQRHTG